MSLDNVEYAQHHVLLYGMVSDPIGRARKGVDKEV
jgi:hypothetical protein